MSSSFLFVAINEIEFYKESTIHWSLFGLNAFIIILLIIFLEVTTMSEGGWREAIPCILYKDNEMIGTFASIGQASRFLENRIGGSLEKGIQELIKGWEPKRGQLKGYSTKRIG
ncbi:hypothetical protein ACX16W_22885 [Bacillus cereus]